MAEHLSGNEISLRYPGKFLVLENTELAGGGGVSAADVIGVYSASYVDEAYKGFLLRGHNCQKARVMNGSVVLI